jgi:hypothetical protein
MFAVIGQKIYEKLRNSLDLLQAQGEFVGTEVVSNTEPFTTTNGWFSTPTPPRYVSATNDKLVFQSTDSTVSSLLSTSIFLNSGGTYVCEYSLESLFTNQVMIGQVPYSSSIYGGPIEQSGDIKRSFRFTVGAGGYMFLSFVAFSDTAQASILKSVTIKAVDTDAKISPVVIPQGTEYPATTYEIANVSNFLSKGSSLNSCDVSVNISCFADRYAITYNQAKAIVDALDLYEVTYTEDGQSYTAKFRFENLDDEYFKTPEKFYKNLTFNCLIIKN